MAHQHPDTSIPVAGIAKIWLKARRPDRALDVLSHYRGRTDELDFFRGAALFETGHVQEARAILTELAARRPENTAVQQYLTRLPR